MATIPEIIESIGAALTIIATLPLSPMLRVRYNREGATEAELNRSYPGDERVPQPRQIYTRAITIQAEPERVWAYLVQLGQDRAGMYSYDALENLAGCQIHSVDRVLPQFQNPQIGDVMRFGPKGSGYPLQKLVAFEPVHYLIWAGADPKTEAVPDFSASLPKSYVNATWGFYLERVAEGTRLISRSRLDHSGERAMVLIWRITEVLNLVMERKMLRMIRQYAERDMGQPQPSLA